MYHAVQLLRWKFLKGLNFTGNGAWTVSPHTWYQKSNRRTLALVGVSPRRWPFFDFSLPLAIHVLPATLPFMTVPSCVLHSCPCQLWPWVSGINKYNGSNMRMPPFWDLLNGDSLGGPIQRTESTYSISTHLVWLHWWHQDLRPALWPHQLASWATATAYRTVISVDLWHSG